MSANQRTSLVFFLCNSKRNCQYQCSISLQLNTLVSLRRQKATLYVNLGLSQTTFTRPSRPPPPPPPPPHTHTHTHTQCPLGSHSTGCVRHFKPRWHQSDRNVDSRKSHGETVDCEQSKYPAILGTSLIVNYRQVLLLLRPNAASS